MASHRPVYVTLRQEWKGQLLRYFFVQGHGGPLLFLWTIGSSLFLFIFGLPIYALAWTGVVVTLGFWTICIYRGNLKVREQLLQSSIAERFPWHTLSDRSLQMTVQKSANVFVEVALKVYALGRAGDARAELERVLAAASGLLSLQYELARKAEDLVHGLTFIVPEGPVGTDLMTEAPTVCHETVDAVQKEADQARALASEIGQQLETLMLRVFQLQVLTVDRQRAAGDQNTVPGAAELARDIETTLDRAHGKVKSLHQVTPPLADSHAPPDLRPLLESLQHGFSRSKSTHGLGALQQLAYEYTELQLVLERRKETDSLSVAQIPPLAEETYRQGLGVLNDALGVLQSIHSSDRGRLKAEVAELEGEISGLREDDGQVARVKMKEETLASHRERLEMVSQQQSHLEELLHQCGRCEASLHRTRIQLAELKAESSKVSISAVTQTLRRTINQAREVQAEMKRLGY